MRSNRSFPHCQRGATLVEVLGALALMSAVLVALLVAKGRSIRQTGMAMQRLEAVAAAERLLASWWEHPEQIPRVGEGGLDQAPGLSWRTRPVAGNDLHQYGTEVVRIEVFETTSRIRLTSVDILLPEEIKQ